MKKMKSKYAKKLNNTNILLGTHIAFKLVIILILFVILYTTIWIQEKYLIYIKISAYTQIFIFLSLSMVMLVINNPYSMDICSNYVNNFYLFGSILEFVIIVMELIFLIQNLKEFLIPFHDCPYYRSYQDIADLDYKRTCLFYDTDINHELPHKYICYYNSEDEYYNSFCDGLICKKNNNRNEINSFIKCYKNVDKNDVQFSLENEFYLKEFELIYKYKSSNLYTCFRKNKIEKKENIFNEKCPDSNPVKKMIIFIYSLFILHFLIDFLFIYELIAIKRLKQMYSELIKQKNSIPVDVLSNQDDINFQNLEYNSNSNNKPTYNTDNINTVAYPSYNIQKENSQSIIIVPPYKDSEFEEIKNNLDQGRNATNTHKSSYSQLYQYDNIMVHYNQNDNCNNNDEKADNDCVIKRKGKIINNKDINMNKRDSIQQLIDSELNRENSYSINRMNFFIDNQKYKKKVNQIMHNNNEVNLNENNLIDENNSFNTNISEGKKNNINLNQIQPIYNNNYSRNNTQNIITSSKDFNSQEYLCDANNEITKKIKKSSKNKDKKTNINNYGIDKEFININIDELTKNNEQKNLNKLQKDLILNSTINLKEEENMDNKENKSDNIEYRNENNKNILSNNIYMNKEEEIEKNSQNLIKINRSDNNKNID